MKSEDTPILGDITTALNNLRSQGTPIGVDVRQVTMAVHGHTVIYAFDDQNNDWNITAQ